MDEAAVTIVARMTDEASPGMQNLAKNTEQVRAKMMDSRMQMMITASAMSSMASLLRQIDHPAAKAASNFLAIGTAVLMSASAIQRLIPVIMQATAAMRSMAVVKGVLAALSGPAGWAMLGVGAAVGAGAAVGISRATRPREEGTTQNIYVAGSIISERELATTARQHIIGTQQRNAGRSGIT